jgi:hypothetical protein
VTCECFVCELCVSQTDQHNRAKRALPTIVVVFSMTTVLDRQVGGGQLRHLTTLLGILAS